MRLLKLYGLAQIAVFLFFGISGLPGRGRPWANAHPYVRGGDGTKEGSDVGFNGDL